MTAIKPTYIVTDMDFALAMHPDTGDLMEFKTERTALKEATQMLANSNGDDTEVWVWRLTHVLSKPDLDPVIAVVK
jgi:hypothetical protein